MLWKNNLIQLELMKYAQNIRINHLYVLSSFYTWCFNIFAKYYVNCYLITFIINIYQIGLLSILFLVFFLNLSHKRTFTLSSFIYGYKYIIICLSSMLSRILKHLSELLENLEKWCVRCDIHIVVSSLDHTVVTLSTTQSSRS